MSAKAATAKGMHDSVRLKAIQPRSMWGCRSLSNKRSLLALDDHEYIVSSGGGLMVFSNKPGKEEETYMCSDHHEEVLCPTFIATSPDNKFLVSLVQMKVEDPHTTHMLIYTTEYLRVEFRAPKLVSFQNPDFIIGGDGVQFTCAAFSHDNQFIACGTTLDSCGIVIFDHKKGSLFQSIATDSTPGHLSFDPRDATHLCATGSGDLFTSWKFTSKSVTHVPITGLRGKGLNYTYHVWVPPFEEGVIVAATENGFLTLVQHFKQKGHNLHCFGTPSVQGESSSFEAQEALSRRLPVLITQLLLRDEVLLAVSQYNEVAAFRLSLEQPEETPISFAPPLLASTGGGKITSWRDKPQTPPTKSGRTELVALSRYRVSDVDQLRGVAWCEQSSKSSFRMMAMSSDRVFTLDVKGDQATRPSSAAVSLSRESKFSDVAASADWVPICSESTLFQYHSQAVHSLSMASRTNTLVTNSYLDGTVRMWDYTEPSSFKGFQVVERLINQPQDNPVHVDVHPSGTLAAFATESEVREYVLTNNCLELHRRINIRGPFVGANGHAYIISQPVSLVKYSTGGQYIAVVTGKMAQLFSTNLLDFDVTVNMGITGVPSRVMTMLDHAASITDLAFDRNDTRIITTASDGAIYGWKIGETSRDQEHVFKGVSVNRVAISKTQRDKCTIAVSFDMYTAQQHPSQQGDSSLGRRQSSVKSRRSPMRVQSPPVAQDVPAGHLGARRGSSNVSGFSESTASLLGAKTGTAPVARHFVAFWEDLLSNGPTTLEVDASVCSIALGCTDGPDKFDICVLGLADGRMLVSTLPVPSVLRAVDTTLSPAPSLATTPSLAVINAAPFTTGMNMNASMRGSKREKSRRVLAQDVALAVQDKTVEEWGSAKEEAPKDVEVVAPVPGGKSFSIDLQRLDVDRCRILRSHCGPVDHVGITPNGMWIFSGGADGLVKMYATSKRGLTAKSMPRSPVALENQFFVVESSKLKLLHTQLREGRRTIEGNKKDYDLKVDKILESKGKLIIDLQHRMQAEVQKRDDQILKTRNEYLTLKNSMVGEIAAVRKQCNESTNDLELGYEQKLSQEATYLEQMKRAYDEYVLRSGSDLAELQRKTDSMVVSVQGNQRGVLLEAEKQQGVVLQYFEYIKARNEELMVGLDQRQTEEKRKLKIELAKSSKELEKAQGKLLTGEVQARSEASKLKASIEEREDDVLKLRSTVDWSHNRILELEQGLQQATAELGVRTEMSEKWELKTGEMQQKIIELEKLRKALTMQLHTMRQELGPKEETLMRATEKLHETDKEYELSLQAIAEKEKALSDRSESLNLLQKQVREMRGTTSRKGKVLRRAATLLDEYAFSLEQAYFKAEKRTIGGGADRTGVVVDRKPVGVGGAAMEVVEVITQNDGMKAALKRLSDILTPFFDDESTDAEQAMELEQVRLEQERHMALLHRNVNSLRANLDTTHHVAASKVQHHLGDNQHLLKEVHNLRLEVRALSMDNQRLAAQLEFDLRMSQQRKTSASYTGSQPIFPQYQQQQMSASRDHRDIRGGSSLSEYGTGSGSAEVFSIAEGGGQGRGIKGSKRISKSASQPLLFSVRSMGMENAFAEAARTALTNTPAPVEVALSQPSVPRPMEGNSLQSSLSDLDRAKGSTASSKGGVGASASASKNEFSRSADAKILLLMQLNEQQLRVKKPAQPIPAFGRASLKTKPPAGKSKTGRKLEGSGSVEGSMLEMLGGSAMLAAALSSTSTTERPPSLLPSIAPAEKA